MDTVVYIIMNKRVGLLLDYYCILLMMICSNKVHATLHLSDFHFQTKGRRAVKLEDRFMVKVC